MPLNLSQTEHIVTRIELILAFSALAAMKKRTSRESRAVNRRKLREHLSNCAFASPYPESKLNFMYAHIQRGKESTDIRFNSHRHRSDFEIEAKSLIEFHVRPTSAREGSKAASAFNLELKNLRRRGG